MIWVCIYFRKVLKCIFFFFLNKKRISEIKQTKSKQQSHSFTWFTLHRKKSIKTQMPLNSLRKRIHFNTSKWRRNIEECVTSSTPRNCGLCYYNNYIYIIWYDMIWWNKDFPKVYSWLLLWPMQMGQLFELYFTFNLCFNIYLPVFLVYN